MKLTSLVPLIAVLLVGGVVIAYVAVEGNPFPSQLNGGVVENAVTKLFDTKTFRVDGRIEADIKGIKDESMAEDNTGILTGISSVKVFVDINSAIDQKKQESSTRAVVGLDAEGMQVTGTLEAITKDDKLYIKLVSLPELIFSFLEGLDTIKNQWIEVDFAALKEQYEGVSGVGIDIDEVQIKEQLEQLMESIQELFSERTIFDVKKEYGQETMGDIETEHYLVSANKEEVKKLVYDYAELTMGYVTEEQKIEYQEALDQTLDGFPEALDEFWASSGGIEMDVWIEKGKGRLARIKWQKSMTTSNIKELGAEVEEIVVLIDLKFKDFNEKIEIETPEKTKAFQDVLTEVLAPLMPQDLMMPELPDFQEQPAGF